MCRFMPLALLTIFITLVPLAKPNQAAEKSAAQRRWALLVGVNDYTNLADLSCCSRDMVALRDQLTGSGFPPEQIVLMHDRATEKKLLPFKANIEVQLQLMLSLVEEGDVLLLAFSGHGLHSGGTSYICPAEARIDDPATLIPLDTVYQRVEKCAARFKLMLVDACRNDPFKGTKTVLAPADREAFTDSLAAPPAGILLLSSCAPGQFSMEDEQFGHGVFLHFFMQGLQGKADADRDGNVSLIELFGYSRRETKLHVARKYNALQTPALKGELSDDFAINAVRIPRESLVLDPSASTARAETVTNSLGMKLAVIPAGEFLMGAPDDDLDAQENEQPQHTVLLSRSFLLGVHEVTVAQFAQFVQATGYRTDAEKSSQGGHGYDRRTGEFIHHPSFHWRNPGFPQGSDHPVTNVSWNDANAFCRWLGQKESALYRLPTEAEWEYACRARTTTRFCNGDDSLKLAAVGNVADLSVLATFPNWTTIRETDRHVFTAPAGQFLPNAFGLYDMHGNVWEWCYDQYHPRYYRTARRADPAGPADGEERVVRGSAWDGWARTARSAHRGSLPPHSGDFKTGFRVARNQR